MKNPTTRNQIWLALRNYCREYGGPESVFVEPSKPSPADLPIATRLLSSYQAMARYESEDVQAEDRPNAGIWLMSKNAFHGDLYSALEAGDPERLAAVLRNSLRERLTYGLGPGEETFAAFRDGVPEVYMLIRDRLVSLCIWLGVLPEEGVEQGEFGENARIPTQELVLLAEKALGFQLDTPPIMGNFGFAVGGRIIDVRAPDDAYAAARFKQLLPNSERFTIWEIGGGYGGAALRTLRAGKVDQYSIFDLPSVNLMQGWFLMHALGADAVQLFGELNRTSALVRVRPYWEFHETAERSSLIFNRDSLPEIPEKQARAYIERIAQVGVPFLSINQESRADASQGLKQLRVFDLVAESKLQLVSRQMYWMRAGYLEEVYA